MATQSYRYRAFLSYSSKDKRWGAWLHRTLEAYPVPRRLAGTDGQDGPVPRRLYPVFRDRDELSSSPDLNAQIREALEQSAYLVVICSPRAATSRWVNEEILTFKRLGRENRILAFIVDGEPDAGDGPSLAVLEEEGAVARFGGAVPYPRECLPHALRYRLGDDGELSKQRMEPTAADARPKGDGRNNALLKLVAGLLGIRYDALRQRARRAFALRILRDAVAALAVLAVVFLAGRALYQQRQAESESHAEKAWALYDKGDYAGAVDAVGPGLPTGAGFLFDNASPQAVSAANAALYQDAGLYGLSSVAAFAPLGNGGLAATREGDGFALWDLRSGHRLAVAAGQTSTYGKSGALAPHARRLALTNDAGEIWLVDFRRGTVAPLAYRSAYLRAKDKANIAPPRILSFAPDERRLLVLDDGALAVLDTGANRALSRLAATDDTPLWAGFAADGRDVLGVSANGAWKWTPASAARVPLPALDAKTILAFPTPRTPQTAVTMAGGKAKAVDIVSGKVERDIAVSADTVQAAVEPAGEMVTMSSGGVASVYDAAAQIARRVMLGPTAAGPVTMLDADRIVTGADPLVAWDLARAPYLGALPPLDGPLERTMVFGDRVLTLSKSGAMRLWDAVHRRSIAVLCSFAKVAPGQDPWTVDLRSYPLAVSSDNRFVASVTGDGLTVWDAGTGKTASTLSGVPMSSQIWVSPRAKYAAVQRYFDQPIELWDLASKRLVAHVAYNDKPEPYGHGAIKVFDYGSVHGVAFSPSGRFVAVEWHSLHDSGIDLFSVSAGKHLAKLAGSADAYGRSVTFGPSDDVIEIGSEKIVHRVDRTGNEFDTLTPSNAPERFLFVHDMTSKWAFSQYDTKLPVAYFEDMGAGVRAAPGGTSISDFLALYPRLGDRFVAIGDEQGGISLWRRPSYRSAETLAHDLCSSERGMLIAQGCGRSGTFDLREWLRVSKIAAWPGIPAALLLLAILVLFVSPQLLLSALIFGRRRLIWQTVILSVLFGAGMIFARGATTAIWALTVLILLLVLFGIGVWRLGRWTVRKARARLIPPR